ncbi:MAG: hypothetical protein ACQ9MH_24170 [Nitrospinales bacterium]
MQIPTFDLHFFQTAHLPYPTAEDKNLIAGTSHYQVPAPGSRDGNQARGTPKAVRGCRTVQGNDAQRTHLIYGSQLDGRLLDPFFREDTAHRRPYEWAVVCSGRPDVYEFIQCDVAGESKGSLEERHRQ